jgi:hypothetical protein
MRRVNFVGRAERIRRSAHRLETVEQLGAPALFRENERRILRRHLAELQSVTEYSESGRWFEPDSNTVQ